MFMLARMDFENWIHLSLKVMEDQLKIAKSHISSAIKNLVEYKYIMKEKSVETTTTALTQSMDGKVKTLSGIKLYRLTRSGRDNKKVVAFRTVLDQCKSHSTTKKAVSLTAFFVSTMKLVELQKWFPLVSVFIKLEKCKLLSCFCFAHSFDQLFYSVDPVSWDNQRHWLLPLGFQLLTSSC